MTRTGVAYACLAVLCLQGCSRPPAEVEEPPVRAVKTLVVSQIGDLAERSFSGALAPAETTRLGFAIGGKLLELPLREGERLAEGQVVARLDPSDISREIASAQARLAAARSRLAEVELNYERQKTLVERGVAARATLDQVTRERDTTRSDVEVATTDLRIAEDRLAKTRLVAPRDGVVTRRLAEQFEEVAPGSAVYEIGSGDTLVAEALVPEQLVSGLKHGMTVQVRLPGLGNAVVDAAISEIAAEAEAGNAFRVKARLTGQPEGARSGMTATVSFALGEPGETLFDVPLSAIAFEKILSRPEAGTRAPVFVLDPAAGVVRRREVDIARVLGNRVLVSEGLAAGEQVVVAGVAFLQDGQPARRWVAHE